MRKREPMTEAVTAWTLELAKRLPEFAEIIVQFSQLHDVSALVDFTMDVPIDVDLVECGNDLEGLLRGLINDLRAPLRKVTAAVSIGQHEPMMLSDGSRIAGFLDVQLRCDPEQSSAKGRKPTMRKVITPKKKQQAAEENA